MMQINLLQALLECTDVHVKQCGGDKERIGAVLRRRVNLFEATPVIALGGDLEFSVSSASRTNAGTSRGPFHGDVLHP